MTREHETTIYHTLGDADATTVDQKVKLTHYSVTDSSTLEVDGQCVLVIDDNCLDTLRKFIDDYHDIIKQL